MQVFTCQGEGRESDKQGKGSGGCEVGVGGQITIQPCCCIQCCTHYIIKHSTLLTQVNITKYDRAPQTKPSPLGFPVYMYHHLYKEKVCMICKFNHFHCCIATAQSGYVISRAIEAQQITKRTQRDKIKMLITATRHRKLEDEDRSQTAL